MAWCKLEDTARHHFKFNQLARELKIRRAEARGLFFSLCSWASMNAPDGLLTGLTQDDIEDASDWQGRPGRCVQALISVRLLDQKDDGSLEIHDFFERAESYRIAKNKRASRDRLHSVTGQGPDRPIERRGEEKRGKERRGVIQRAAVADADSASPVSLVRRAYLAGYKRRYGRDFEGWGKRQNGQAKNLLGDWPLAKVLSLLEPQDDQNGFFFAWRRPEVIKAGHPFGTGANCFVLKIQELDADVNNPERRSEAGAVAVQERQAEKAAANQTALEQYLAEKADKERS